MIGPIINEINFLQCSILYCSLDCIINVFLFIIFGIYKIHYQLINRQLKDLLNVVDNQLICMSLGIPLYKYLLNKYAFSFDTFSFDIYTFFTKKIK